MNNIKRIHILFFENGYQLSMIDSSHNEKNFVFENTVDMLKKIVEIVEKSDTIEVGYLDER